MLQCSKILKHPKVMLTPWLALTGMRAVAVDEIALKVMGTGCIGANVD